MLLLSHNFCLANFLKLFFYFTNLSLDWNYRTPETIKIYYSSVLLPWVWPYFPKLSCVKWWCSFPHFVRQKLFIIQKLPFKVWRIKCWLFISVNTYHPFHKNCMHILNVHYLFDSLGLFFNIPLPILSLPISVSLWNSMVDFLLNDIIMHFLDFFCRVSPRSLVRAIFHLVLLFIAKQSLSISCCFVAQPRKGRIICDSHKR